MALTRRHGRQKREGRGRVPPVEKSVGNVQFQIYLDHPVKDAEKHHGRVGVGSGRVGRVGLVGRVAQAEKNLMFSENSPDPRPRS